VTGIIADGIASGVFAPQDARRAAVFVLGTFGQLHEVVTGPADLAEASAHLHVFVLRGLGHTGAIEHD
jgi:hypothetical protein